jgi:hypothetical protein
MQIKLGASQKKVWPIPWDPNKHSVAWREVSNDNPAKKANLLATMDLCAIPNA